MRHILAQRRQSRRARSVIELIGNTPLVRLRALTRGLPSGVEVLAKLEHFNPGGSSKDRPAWQMIKDAVNDGRLARDGVLIEATTGNTGVSLAMLGAAMGYRVELVMPASVSPMRQSLAAGYGAHITLTDPQGGVDAAIAEVRRRLEADPGGPLLHLDQYNSPANPKAHYLSTGPELWEATAGRVTHLVAGIGSGGTLMGTGRRLRVYNPDVKLIGVEPADALEGFEGLRLTPSTPPPTVYRPDEADQIEAVGVEEGWEMTGRMAREEGLLVGASGGAAIVAALRVAQGLTQGTVVAILPDHIDRCVPR